MADDPGKSSIVSGLTGLTIFESNLIRVRLDTDKCNPLFYYYWLKSRYGKYAIDSLMTGTSIKGIRGSDLNKVVVPFPDVCIQSNIVSKLRSIDYRVSLLHQINDNLSAQLTTVFNKMFAPMIDFEPIIEPNSGWHQETIESISEEIGIGPFGSNIKVETFVEEGIPVISSIHLNDRIMEEKNYNYITKEHANTLKRSIVHSGDIVFTHAGNIGQVSIIPELTKYDYYVLSQRQFFLRCNKNIISPLIMVEYFRSSKGQYELLSNASQTGVPSIARPTTHLKSISVLIPPKELQNKYEQFASSICTQICNHRKEIDSLSLIRDYILPKLMSGEIDVSTLEIPN